MELAALVSFAILLVAWIAAPDSRSGTQAVATGAGSEVGSDTGTGTGTGETVEPLAA